MSHQIASELVANVAQVHVEPGQKVQPGDEVVLLESMKMEIPVLTEIGGTITGVYVSVGDVVQDGDVLVAVD